MSNIENQLAPVHLRAGSSSVATKDYGRVRCVRGYPVVQRWGRWEGRDREGVSLEVDRAAQAGRAWTHAALIPAAPLPDVCAGGFEAGFAETVAGSGRQVILFTLENLTRYRT